MREYRISDPYQIAYILEYCEKIERNIDGIRREKAVFDAEYERQDLLSFYLLQIGEHANNTSEELRETTKENIMWHQIRGMRNRIAHGYKSVNPEIVWEIVTKEISLLRQLAEILEKE
ncbi:MAG: DUF86 domain-containing protein [Clostridia bacterium]|nr:DUF86 domain-containing protein [Clostridia bacterium]